MTITHIQTSGSFDKGTNAAGVPVVFASFTSGNLIRVVTTTYEGDVVAGGVTDNKGNIYTKVISQAAGASNNYISEWFTIASSSGATTVTVDRDAAGGASSYETVAVGEYNSSTGWPINPVDTSAGASRTGANPTSPDAVTTAADCVVVASAGDNTSAANYTPPGGAWTNRWLDNVPGDDYNTLATEEQIVTSAGTYNCTWTRPNSGDVCTIIVAYKANVGGGGGGGSAPVYSSVKMSPDGITPMSLNLQGKNKFDFVRQ